MNKLTAYIVAGSLTLALLIGGGFVLKNNWHHIVKPDNKPKIVAGREKYPTGGDNTFVWKPVSESDGKLAIVTPAKWNHTLVTIEVPGYAITREGYAVWETKGGVSAWSNGNRLTWRWNKPGQPGKATVKFKFLDGKSQTLDIPNGSQRFTKSL